MSAILRLPEVMSRTGLSRSMIYMLQANGNFPRSVALSERAVGWHEAAIAEWISQRRPTAPAPHQLAAHAA